ncbi:endo-1,4-beta-xylanase [Carboxylicivirga marina]|uniref:Beta-xylanase n=1 Tax=Carboxylicivirga marina TaxID=2800988 RepID=A0ABS1HEH0_9BACT|nr:endo-1,4-beta-xylanase [Carboxylicivirga marina]MBK3516068.1 endo-1,4-beta-xylanase [Carboxylicivirga marina]
MKRKIDIVLFLWLGCLLQSAGQNNNNGLAELFQDHFKVGAAISNRLYNAHNSDLDTIVRNNFNSVVAVNCMKSERIQPDEGVFVFKDADSFVKYGEANDMFIVGHTLVWHSQAPDWFFVDEAGNNVSREVLIDRMEKHIKTLVGRYKGRVHGWDVVNEAVVSEGDGWRRSKWYEIIGEEYVELAFQFAHEADPDAELYYNDYNLYVPARREATIKVVKRLLDKGIRIDGIGMQAHYLLDTPLEQIKTSVDAFASLGVNVLVTELDISVLPFPNENVSADVGLSIEYKEKYDPYRNGLPNEMEQKLRDKYVDLFKIYMSQKAVSRVTFWGVSDRYSWKNNFPVKNRTDYPLLWDREFKPKVAFHGICDLMKKQ